MTPSTKSCVSSMLYLPPEVPMHELLAQRHNWRDADCFEVADLKNDLCSCSIRHAKSAFAGTRDSSCGKFCIWITQNYDESVDKDSQYIVGFWNASPGIAFSDKNHLTEWKKNGLGIVVPICRPNSTFTLGLQA